ncbi:hypothetical protein [Nostoc sp.]|uniref:hypothetical protein n=1 Tax=Nostoc sp. TaxID=1180 RepID=UPI003FA585C4
MGLEQDMTENLQNDLKGAFFRWISALKRHCRSLAETTMFRFKPFLGGSPSSPDFDNKAVELFIKCAALNRIIQIAKLHSCQVGA